MVDLDGDGVADVLSGSWPGEIHVFRGKGKGEFAAPEKLRHADGKAINVCGGRRDSGDMILVAGDARYENTEKGRVIVYEGERIEIPEGREAGITGTASAVHASDWDGDGDLDLVVGEIFGTVSIVPNEGTAKAWSFGKPRPIEAGGTPLRVEGDAGPFVADWDGDGLADLLVGAGDGSVSLFRNEGTRKEPKLAAARILVPKTDVGRGDDVPAEPRRGHRAKICAADWNGDGRLDLLLGDFTMQKPVLPEFTAEQKAEHARLRKELEEVRNRYSELSGKVRGLGRLKDPEEQAKVQKELGEVRSKWREIQGKLPPGSENHGWIWLFLRRPAGEKAPER